jgi:HlyD family secretion protein
VDVIKAEVGTQTQKIVATGVVASQTGTQVKIGSQITGRIRALPADVGTQVKANQIVAVLDLPDEEAQVDQQRQAVIGAQAGLAQARSRFEQATETAGYTQDQTRAQVAEAEAALRSARAKADSASAAARLQPIQTSTDIQRAQAALSSANSGLRQVEQTIRQQIQQSQANLDDAQVGADNAERTLRRQQKLLAKGFIAQEVVDQSEATYKQAVAKLDNMKASLDIAHEKTRADLQSAQDQVAQAQAALDAAKAEKFQDTVHAADLLSAVEAARQAEATLELQKANHREDRLKRMAIEEARSAMLQAEATLSQAQAQLRYQLDQQAKTVIRSPIRGTVLSITAQQGETVAAGLSAPTLITVADLSRLEVRAYVDETDIGHVRLNLPAEVRVEAFPGQVFRGHVTKIASASTIKDNVVTYETTVTMDDTKGLLRPDMTADVSLILGSRPNLLLVPSESIHQQVSRSFVYVYHPDRKGADSVELRTVKTGFDDGTRTEIKQGLNAGEPVVVAGLTQLGVRPPDSQGGGAGR